MQYFKTVYNLSSLYFYLAVVKQQRRDGSYDINELIFFTWQTSFNNSKRMHEST